MRKQTRKARMLSDNWPEFKAAMVEKVTDQMGARKD